MDVFTSQDRVKGRLLLTFSVKYKSAKSAQLDGWLSLTSTKGMVMSQSRFAHGSHVSENVHTGSSIKVTVFSRSSNGPPKDTLITELPMNKSA